MQIYTSYFAKLRKLPEDVVPISICGRAPEWYTGLQYKKLAPKYWFFKQYCDDHDESHYTKCFKEEVTGVLKADEVILSLQGLLTGPNKGKDIALICYEKPTDFCHRHLVAEWLNENGYECEEWKEKEKEEEMQNEQYDYE